MQVVLPPRPGWLAVEFAPPGLHLPLAFGDLPALFASLDPAPLVVVGRVVGPALPIELAIYPAQRFGVGSHLGTERLEERGLQGRHRDGRGSQIQPHDPAAQRVARLLVRHPPAHQLGGEAIALPELAADQANVLHRAGQPMRLHQVLRIEERRQHQPHPFHVGPAPAGAAGLRLALDGVQLVPTPRAGPGGLSPRAADWQRGRPEWPAPGSSGCPDAPPARRARTAGRRRAARTRDAVLGARLPGALLPRGIVAGQRSGVLVGFGLAHQPHPACEPDPGRHCRPGGPLPAGRAAPVPGHD